MESSNALSLITLAVRSVLEDDSISLDYKTVASDIVGWDSLAQIDIVLYIERELSVTFSVSEVSRLSNVGDMVELVKRASLNR